MHRLRWSDAPLLVCAHATHLPVVSHHLGLPRQAAYHPILFPLLPAQARQATETDLLLEGSRGLLRETVKGARLPSPTSCGVHLCPSFLRYYDTRAYLPFYVHLEFSTGPSPPFRSRVGRKALIFNLHTSFWRGFVATNCFHMDSWPYCVWSRFDPCDVRNVPDRHNVFKMCAFHTWCSVETSPGQDQPGCAAPHCLDAVCCRHDQRHARLVSQPCQSGAGL